MLATLFHYSLTAEYGDITATARESLGSAIKGLSPMLLLVVGAGLAAFLLSSKRWVRLTAVSVQTSWCSG